MISPAPAEPLRLRTPRPRTKTLPPLPPSSRCCPRRVPVPFFPIKAPSPSDFRMGSDLTDNSGEPLFPAFYRLPHFIHAVVDRGNTGHSVDRRSIVALTQFWCIRGLVGAEESGLKEIELSTAVHLAFHELELCDLALCLAVGPSQSDCGADGGLVFDDPGGE